MLHAAHSYPRQAKRRHWEGIATLQFTLLPDGRITGLALLNSSGKSLLDEAALDIIRERMANHFRPFPESVARPQWPIQVPVSFRLQ
ncbi:MAG: energy transducer TonB [Gammaproteobacteria bacterium]|nr:energy transducer TonB [Gammaproteobacteria bacterium]